MIIGVTKGRSELITFGCIDAKAPKGATKRIDTQQLASSS
ncbi:unnamed protein product [Thelazia callipaeda]|uniref:Transposase n=1 Tax=Thelazia callipaeda TaxID=103827 RepID=A0A0N5DA78_THECL|nr:unnamed protein product [Thelazia callipaeda]